VSIHDRITQENVWVPRSLFMHITFKISEQGIEYRLSIVLSVTIETQLSIVVFGSPSAHDSYDRPRSWLTCVQYLLFADSHILFDTKHTKIMSLCLRKICIYLFFVKLTTLKSSQTYIYYIDVQSKSRPSLQRMLLSTSCWHIIY